MTEIDCQIFNQFNQLEIIEYKGKDGIKFENEITNSHLYGIKSSNNYQSTSFCGKEINNKLGKLTSTINWIITEGKLNVYGKGEIPDYSNENRR